MFGMKKLQLVAALGLTAGGLVFGIHTAHAKEGHDKGAHDHGGHGAGGGLDKLTLDKGAKWKTDDTLREQMSGIQKEFGAALDAIHAETYTPDQYEALAASIDGRLSTIFSKCKLPPEADAQAHFVLSEIIAGTTVMRGDGDRMSGAVKVFKALAAYGKHFDHPGWKPLSH